MKNITELTKSIVEIAERLDVIIDDKNKLIVNLIAEKNAEVDRRIEAENGLAEMKIWKCRHGNDCTPIADNPCDIDRKPCTAIECAVIKLSDVEKAQINLDTIDEMIRENISPELIIKTVELIRDLLKGQK